MSYELTDEEDRSENPGANLPEITPDQLRAKLAIPARCLAALSFISCGTDLIAGLNTLVGDSPKMVEDYGLGWGIALATSSFIAMLLLVFVHFWLGVTAMQMHKLENYPTMRLAATIASIPFITPIVFLGMPFGLWIHFILRKPSAQSVIESLTIPDGKKPE